MKPIAASGTFIATVCGMAIRSSFALQTVKGHEQQGTLASALIKRQAKNSSAASGKGKPLTIAHGCLVSAYGKAVRKLCSLFYGKGGKSQGTTRFVFLAASGKDKTCPFHGKR